MNRLPSHRTIGRLSQYRRLLGRQLAAGREYVYSHQLARVAGVTAAQVRRDLMVVGATGSSKRGYDVSMLIDCLGRQLDDPDGQRVALIGVGNLGRALLAYFQGRRPKLTIVAAFDTDPSKTDRVICGCRCHPMDRLQEVISEEGIAVAIIAVPAAAAQETASHLEAAGVRGILNFAPLPLSVGPEIVTDDIDMTMALERIAYFARQKRL